MFNDLTQSNQPSQPNQTGGAPLPPVDDIFADTDKTAEANKFSGYYANTGVAPTPTEVDAQKVGLSASEPLPVSSKGKILKVALIALLIILLISLGYLVYAKFLSGQVVEEEIEKIDSVATKTVEVINPTPTTTEPEIVVPVSEEIVVSTSTPLTTTTPPVANLADTDSDGLTDEEEGVLGTDINMKDTDDDGLSDYDEVKIYNTNADKIDSDADGLSDYEEVKIYQTDPLKADTDGDTYTDGGEVKGGYNPLGEGKLTDIK